MEKSSELIVKLNYDLGFLFTYVNDDSISSVGHVVYDALLHMQNTPGATVEDACNYIRHVSDNVHVEYQNHEVYDDLPF
jgi:hypothetical protein